MFLREYFKKWAERRVEKKRELEERKKYWGLSKTLCGTIMYISKQMDNTLPLEYIPNKPNEWPKLGTWSLKVDDRLTVEIELLCPKEVKLMAYEARFFIDNVPVNLDLTTDWMPEFGKLVTIVCDELKKRGKEYAEKKNAVVNDYISWKDGKANE